MDPNPENKDLKTHDSKQVTERKQLTLLVQNQRKERESDDYIT